MRVVAQRVDHARVSVEGEIAGEIKRGLMLLVSAGENDTVKDLDWMAGKVVNLRIFPDQNDKMNFSVQDIDGEILAISQFTLHGDCRKGNRPSFVKSMKPEPAKKIFDEFVEKLKALGVKKVATGVFGAMMDVELLNNGPVTMLLDSEKSF